MRREWERLTLSHSTRISSSDRLTPYHFSRRRTLQAHEASARRAVVVAIPSLSVACLRHSSNPHGAGAFRLSTRSVAPLLDLGKLSAIEAKHEKPKGG